MKKYAIFLSILVITFLFSQPLLFSAEVSEKQDIAIFGLTSYAFDIPDEVRGYVESSINNVFVNLKRFNVLGYGDYRMEMKDIGDFIERIREIRSGKALEAGTYDEKFGTVVIRGEDFDRIAGSFLVVVPSLSNFTVGVQKEEVVSGNKIYIVNSYTVDLVVDLTFVNAQEGKQEEALRITGTGTDENIDRANKQAVESAISMLSLKIRQIGAFKIKSGVIRVRGDTVFFELGSDIGVKPGDEYEILTRQEVGRTGRIVQLPTGLVRVKKVYPDVTEAKVVFQKERITEGDQLVEAAKAGAQLSFKAGVMKVDIPDMNYDIILIGDLFVPPFSSYYYISLNQRNINYAPAVGLSVEKALGYRFKGVFDGTALLNFPLFGGIGELGVGAQFQKRRLSIDLTALGGVLYMSTFQKDLNQFGLSPFLIVEGTTIDFGDNPFMNIYGISVGVKGKAGLTLLVKPNFAFHAGVGYRLYTPVTNWRIHIEETSGNKESVDIGSDSPNIAETPESGGMKRVSISGYEINLSFILRF